MGDEFTPEHLELLSQYFKITGKEEKDCESITLGEYGAIIIETGKLNIERFIRKVMEY